MFGIKFDQYWERRFMAEKHISEEELSERKKDFEEFVLETMRSLATNHWSEVKFYSYRSARVFDEMFDADRDSMLPLEYMLAIKAGVEPDNHTVYEVYNGRYVVYVWCTDGLCRVGKTIQKGSY